MKKLLQNKKTWIIGGCAVVLVIALILCIALAPGKSDPPVDEPTESTTDTTTPDASTGDIVVDIQDETSETESGVDENGDVIPDGGGLVIDPGKDTSTGTTTGEKVEEPAKPVQPTEPKPDDTTSGGGIVIGTPGETPVYSCGTANHNCENEDYHKGLLAREAEGCPYCGSHSCISFYTLDQWGHTFYDPSACPKYDIHSDPAKYCQVCGKKQGDGRNGTCVTFNIDIDCPNCGKHVKAWECHYCG